MKLYLLALGLCIPTTSFSGGELVAQVYNYATGYYNKQLLEAADAGNKDGVEYALDNGANINYQKPFSPDLHSTALHYCAKNGNQKIARILLDRGAQTTIVNLKGLIPLSTAACAFQSGMFKLLLKKTPECSTKTEQCKKSKDLIINFQCGVYLIPHRDAIVNTAHEYLTKRMGTLVARTLKPLALFTDLPLDIKKIIIDFALTKNLERDLFEAILGIIYSGEHIKEVETALRAGANVNMSLKPYRYIGINSSLLKQLAKPTLFHMAVLHKHRQLATLLLDYGIDITAIDLRKDFAHNLDISLHRFRRLILKHKAKKAQSSVAIEEIE